MNLSHWLDWTLLEPCVCRHHTPQWAHPRQSCKLAGCAQSSLMSSALVAEVRPRAQAAASFASIVTGTAWQFTILHR